MNVFPKYSLTILIYLFQSCLINCPCSTAEKGEKNVECFFSVGYKYAIRKIIMIAGILI
jgi:hypothetical protein